jgi:hypothetical protein
MEPLTAGAIATKALEKTGENIITLSYLMSRFQYGDRIAPAGITFVNLSSLLPFEAI